jgi:phytoene dehydrogenase-like protein
MVPGVPTLDSRLSTCSYICHILQKKVIDDLELRRYGFRIHSLDPSRTQPFPSGKSITIWHDDEMTAEEIRSISEHDADAWPEWANLWHRAVRILSDYYHTPPPSLAQLTERFRQEGEEELLETLLTVPLKDLADRYFESDEIRTLVRTGPLDQGDDGAPGSAYIRALYAFSAYREDTENYGIVEGGMGGITQAMARSAEANGVSIRTGAQVKRIVTSNGRATGVELEDGELIEADIVVSNADPKRTFLRMLDSETLAANFIDDIRSLKIESASAKFLCALRELPDFSGSLGSEYDPKNLAMMSITSADGPQTSWNDAMNGRVSETPLIQIQIPTVYDKTVAPDGHHVLSMWVYYLPPHVKDGGWENARQQLGEQLIDEVSRYAPNFRDVIVDWTLLTPEDIEDRIGMTDGNIRHVDMIPQQMMSRRPLPGWTDYRTPLQGLYLCGAGTHPGGEVSGAPGHNAAHVILDELGLSEELRPGSVDLPSSFQVSSPRCMPLVSPTEATSMPKPVLFLHSGIAIMFVTAIAVNVSWPTPSAKRRPIIETQRCHRMRRPAVCV